MDYSQLDHSGRLLVAAPPERCRQLLATDVIGTAVAIAESVVHDDLFTSTLSYRVDVSVQHRRSGADVLTRDVPGVRAEELARLSPQGIIRVGSLVSCGELLVGRLGFSSADDSVRYDFLDPGLVTAVTVRAPYLFTCGTCGEIADRLHRSECPICQRRLSAPSRETTPGGDIHVVIELLVRRPLRVGDVLRDERGASLVVACILPDGAMPSVDSLAVRCLIDSRSQAADQLDRTGNGSHARLRGVPTRHRVFRYGRLTLVKQSLRLEQKLSACGYSRYDHSLVTKMPLRKPELFRGGQHLPRDRTRALMRQGFRENVRELLTLKSDAYDVHGEIPQHVRAGTPLPRRGSEASRRLFMLLKSLCISPLLATAAGATRRWGEAAGDEAVLLTLEIARAHDVREWSFGEVKKPETINHRTYRPVEGGLMCEKIFGPEKDWECSCGKYRGMKYKGMICDRCGVKVARSDLRRTRLGHIELAAAVLHPLFLDDVADLLGIDHDALRSVTRHDKHVVTSSTTDTLMPTTVLGDEELRRGVERLGANAFVAASGAEAIRTLLMSLNLDARCALLRRELHGNNIPTRRAVLERQLAAAEAFQSMRGDMARLVLDAIPVLPADLRPLVMLKTGEFVSRDVNDLYAAVIRRNESLKRGIDLNSPDAVLRGLRRGLQQAVEGLFDNERLTEPVHRNAHTRPLRSLSGELDLAAGHVDDKDVECAASAVVVADSSQEPGRTIGVPPCVAIEMFAICLANWDRTSAPGTTAGGEARRPCATAPLDAATSAALQQAMDARPLLVVSARHRAKGLSARLVDGEAVRMHPDDAAALELGFDGQPVSLYLPLGNAAVQEVLRPSRAASDDSVLTSLDRDGVRAAVLPRLGVELPELDCINCGFP